DAHTFEVGYVHPVGHWTWSGRVRYYTQGQADFYSDLFAYPNSQTHLARDKELSAFSGTTLGAGVSYEWKKGTLPGVERLQLSLLLDYLKREYDNLRDVTASGTYLPGTEPLYEFDAFITRASLILEYCVQGTPMTPKEFIKKFPIATLLLCSLLVGLCLRDAVAAEPVADTEAPVGISVEELKKKVIATNRDLFILEEDLLFPASTQFAVYLSLDAGKFLHLDSVKLKVGDDIVASHLYTERQVRALQNGAMQRIHIGNLKT